MLKTASKSMSRQALVRRTQFGERPGTFLGRLPVSRKIGLLSAVLLLPGLIPTVTSTLSVRRDLAQVTQQRSALPAFEQAARFQTEFETYAFARAAAQGGAVSGTAPGVAQAVPASLSAAAQAYADALAALPASQTPQAADPAALPTLLGKLRAPGVGAPELAQLYRDAQGQVLIPQLAAASRESGLSVTGQAGVEPLQELLSRALPALRADVVGWGLAPRPAATPGVSAADLTQARAQLATVTRLVEEALTDPVVRESDLSVRLEAVRSKTASFLAAAQGGQVNTAAAREAAQALASLQQAATATVSEQIGNRYASDSRRQLLLLLSVLVLGGLALTLARFLSRSITGPLSQLTQGARELQQGNFASRVPVQSQDELGQLGLAFNAASARLQKNAERAEIERGDTQRLQENIEQLLDVTMDISEGDLTRRGVVSEDILGNVVDSINLMVEQLGQTLRGVQGAAHSVAQGSEQVLGTAADIRQGTQLTSEQAAQVAAQLQQLSAGAAQVAASAQASAQTARQALLAAQQGEEAVQQTLGGMQNIRREVQQVSKRVKNLGDRSLEIQEIVDTISQIAEQTHLLAVNASIEAAGAGEAGGRFAIVADSVRKLAQTTTQAAVRVDGLIRAVQVEVQDVILNTETGTREVEQGYRVAGLAGERLRQIGDYTEQTAKLAEGIAQSIGEQASGTRQMNDAARTIASAAQQAEVSVQAGQRAAEELRSLADELRTSLGRFRLN